MSMTYWVKEVAVVLYKQMDFYHPLVNMNEEDSILYIKTNMKNIDLKQFAK